MQHAGPSNEGLPGGLQRKTCLGSDCVTCSVPLLFLPHRTAPSRPPRTPPAPLRVPHAVRSAVCMLSCGSAALRSGDAHNFGNVMVWWRWLPQGKRRAFNPDVINVIYHDSPMTHP